MCKNKSIFIFLCDQINCCKCKYIYLHDFTWLSAFVILAKSPKRKIKKSKIENYVSFLGFESSKVKKKRSKNHQSFIFGFQ